MPNNHQAISTPRSRGIVRTLQRIFMQTHIALYQLTGGIIGAKAPGQNFLLLTTTGRKSGIERTTPLFYFPDGQRFIVIASNWGGQQHPTWWLNLQAHPQAQVQLGAKHISVTASEATTAERERLWSIIEARYKNFVAYQQHVTRKIPVVILTPAH